MTDGQTASDPQSLREILDQPGPWRNAPIDSPIEIVRGDYAELLEILDRSQRWTDDLFALAVYRALIAGLIRARGTMK